MWEIVFSGPKNFSDFTSSVPAVFQIFNISKEDTIRKLMKEFSLSEPEAVSYVKKYW